MPDVTAPIFVPVRLVSEQNQREHWSARKRRAEAQKLAVTLVLQSSWGRRPPDAPLVVRITRVIGCRGKRMDTDGAVASAKHVRDAVANWLGIDDARDDLVAYHVDQVRAANGTHGARIEIRPMTASEARAARKSFA